MRILIPILLFSFAFSQEYCAGDQISQDHQNQEFDVCYPCDTCDPWSLSQYAGDIIFLDMSASWCAPCFSAIDFIDQLEEYWTGQNPNVKFVTALADIGEPYSCEQWGIQGTPGSPLIVEDDGTLFNWFKDSNGQYPSYVLIDHEMRVRAKPSSVISNANLNECDGSVEDISSFDGGCLNEMITQLLDECGEGCSSGAGCSDENACNNGENTDCIYADDNLDCCGECTAEIDCAGICGGNTPEDDPACSESTGDCPTCLIVPSEHFATVQSGIDAAVDGDTVIVEPGIYYENLVIQKSITLASRAIFDDLSSWVGYADEYYVINDNINATVLDGSLDTNGDGLESVILIDSPSDECIEPGIFGFTITGGNGTVVMVEVNDREGGREEVEQIRGGGFLSRNALPSFKYNAIVNNKGTGDDKVHSGGGGEQSNGDQIRMRETEGDYTWGDGRTECSGNIDLSFNFYKDNDATYGNTFSTLDFEGTVDMSNSIFDVYNCPEDEVTTVWVDVEDEVEVDFSYGVGDLCSITDDVWVSPDGDDNNLGTSVSEAFLTIQRALEMIAPEDGAPITINLTEGTFAPLTTGENFPILMISNVNLIGQGEEVTILDAEESGGVIRMENCQNNIISDLTVTGGYIYYDPSNFIFSDSQGGGIYIYSSNPLLKNVIIIANNSGIGVVYIVQSNPIFEYVKIMDNENGLVAIDSNPMLTNVIISENLSQIAFSNSNPILMNVDIKDQTHGISFNNNSNPILKNVKITGIAGTGPAVRASSSHLTLINVTIADNYDDLEISGGIWLTESSIYMINSILWNNYPQSIYTNNEVWMELLSGINHSNIEGIEEEVIGGGNIDADPLFIDPDNGNYNLQNGSPCIDAGDPSLWYQDMDGSMGDMGFAGGLNILPNFTSYDFGEVGDIESTKKFTIYNYRESPISISTVNFTSSSFSTQTNFPIIIEPFKTGSIYIDANNSYLGMVLGEMELISDDLPDGLSVSLSVTGTEGNVLNGNLSGTYEVNTYRISGDLTIAIGDTAYLQAGTQFLFDGAYNFNIYGVLKVIGTESDSIIFDNYGDESWRGFALNGVSEETVFEFVRISGSEKDIGGGLNLISSNPMLTNVKIENNIAYKGAGMHLNNSNPILTNVTIKNNFTLNAPGSTGNWGGGGIFLDNSNPILTSVIISQNSSMNGAGMYLYNSSPYLEYVTINNNNEELLWPNGNGGGMYLDNSHPTLENVVINENNIRAHGAGIYLSVSNPTFRNVSIGMNSGDNGSGIYLSSSNPILENVIIENNIGIGTSGGGAGMLIITSNPILNNVIIRGNTANAKGGGIYLTEGGTLNFANQVLISNNYSIGHGGGLFVSVGSNVNLQNSTIAANIVGEGDVFGAGIYSDGGTVNLVNSIVYYNRREGDFGINYNLNGYTMEMLEEFNVTYSDIEGDENWVPEGDENISLDPEFVDFENEGDFNLQSNSPCIDAGIIMEGIEYYGTAPDMGAFEWYPEDSEFDLGDFNGDGQIDVLDVVALVANILSAGEYNPAGDLEEDGVLNVLDIVALVNIILGGG